MLLDRVLDLAAFTSHYKSWFSFVRVVVTRCRMGFFVWTVIDRIVCSCNDSMVMTSLAIYRQLLPATATTRLRHFPFFPKDIGPVCDCCLRNQKQNFSDTEKTPNIFFSFHPRHLVPLSSKGLFAFDDPHHTTTILLAKGRYRLSISDMDMPCPAQLHKG